MSFNRRLIGLIFLLGNVLHLHSQEGLTFKVVQWTEKGVLVTPLNSSEAVLFPPKGEKISIQAPAKLPQQSNPLAVAAAPGDIFWFEGRYYCQVFGPEPGHPEQLRSELHRLEGGAWSRIGWFSRERSQGRVLFFPLGSGKFLGLSKRYFRDSTGKARTSPFAIFSRHPEREEFLFDNEVELGMDKKLFEKLDPFQLWTTTLIAFTDGDLTLALPKSSLYWTFSLETGRLRRHGRFMDKATDELISVALLPSLLLNLQPAPDGSILLAMRHADMLTEMKDGLADIKHIERLLAESKGADASNALKAWRQRQDELASRFPFVQWWSYEPSTGAVRRLDPPPQGAKQIVATFADLRNMNWVPTRDGRVLQVSGDFRELETKPSPAPVAKSSKGKSPQATPR
jgi:hypothetical protein